MYFAPVSEAGNKRNPMTSKVLQTTMLFRTISALYNR